MPGETWYCGKCGKAEYANGPCEVRNDKNEVCGSGFGNYKEDCALCGQNHYQQEDSCAVLGEEGLKCEKCGCVIKHRECVISMSHFDNEDIIHTYECACNGPTPEFIYGGNYDCIKKYIDEHGEPPWLVEEQEKSNEHRRIELQAIRLKRCLQEIIGKDGETDIDTLDRFTVSAQMWALYDEGGMP